MTPAIPRTLIAADGLTSGDVAAALNAFCKSENCVVRYGDDFGPDWTIYIGQQQIGSIAGGCEPFRWCLQTYDFPRADAFWSDDRLTLLRQHLAKRGGDVRRVHCGPQNGTYKCADGNNGNLPVSPAKAAYAEEQLESLRAIGSRYQHGIVWVLGLPRATASTVQPILDRFCESNDCYAVLNHVSKRNRYLFNIPGVHVPKPHWVIYSSIDSSDIGNFDEHCPAQHRDDYCLWLMNARGDAFWTEARVAQLEEAFDAANVRAEMLDCWPGGRGLGQSRQEVCETKATPEPTGH